MSTVNGFQVGNEVLKYNYESLENYNTPNFSTSSSTQYAVGDYVTYQGKLYKCTTATTGGTWVNGSWELAILSDDLQSLGDEVEDLNRQISDVESALMPVIFPNGQTTTNTFTVDSTELSAANNYVDLGLTLDVNVQYNFSLAFSAAPTNLSNVYMNTSRSGSGSVATVTSQLVGDQTKTFSYTPDVTGVKYIRIQFTSSYSGDLSIEITGTYDVENDNAIDIIDNQFDTLGLTFDEIEVNTTRPYNLIPTNCVITPLSAIRYGNGEVVADATRCVTDYIPIDATKGYICNCAKVLNRSYNETTQTYDTDGLNPLVLRYMAFYDEEKKFVATSSANDSISKVIPETAKYIRVTIASPDLAGSAVLIYGNYDAIPNVRYIRHRLTSVSPDVSPNTGFEDFKMVMFGDSITQGDLYIDNGGVSYVDYANDILHSNIINVGFGGTRMSHNGASGDTVYFSFDNLCDAIVTNTWTDQESGISTQPTFDVNLAKLKAIDWDTVDAIGLLYGANDWASNTPISSTYELNSGTYNGACAYGLDKLLTAYPHLQVILFTPMFREKTLGDESTSSDHANTANLTMADYGESLKVVQNVMHCALVDSGKTFGMNKYNIHLYTIDGTHPRTNMAQNRLGYLFAQAIQQWISPYGNP